MVFQKAISCLQNLASRKAKNASKESDVSTEIQTARAGHEGMQFSVNVERPAEQQVNSFKQRQSKRHTFQEFAEEIEPKGPLNLMFDYFD